jgi:hypothetical protein
VEDSDKFNRSETLVTNCLFLYNKNGTIASSSVGENNYVNTVVRNSTFFRNENRTFFKVTYPSYKYSVDTFNNKMLVENCLVWEPNFDPTLLIINHNPAEPLYYPSGWGYTFRNTLLPTYALDTLVLTGGHFFESVVFKKYPEFEDTINGDFRLKTCSPFVNKGINSGILSDSILTDLVGLPRIAHDTVDMGAYEQQAICTSGTLTLHGPIEQIQIVPNPSLDGNVFLNFSKTKSRTGNLKVLNAQGKMVVSKENHALNEQEINFGNLPPGLYFILVEADGLRYSGKWVKL